MQPRSTTLQSIHHSQAYRIFFSVSITYHIHILFSGCDKATHPILRTTFLENPPAFTGTIVRECSVSRSLTDPSFTPRGDQQQCCYCSHLTFTWINYWSLVHPVLAEFDLYAMSKLFTHVNCLVSRYLSFNTLLHDQKHLLCLQTQLHPRLQDQNVMDHNHQSNTFINNVHIHVQSKALCVP